MRTLAAPAWRVKPLRTSRRARQRRRPRQPRRSVHGPRRWLRRRRVTTCDRLNAVLPTRVTERGLVSEVGGVQFATGTANLNAAARESLAKFAGIVASYPKLRYDVEGHTDSTGSAAKNQELSLKRAIAVRDYLIAQGIAASATDVAGLGPTPRSPTTPRQTVGRETVASRSSLRWAAREMITVVMPPFLPRAPYATADMPWVRFRAGWACAPVATRRAYTYSSRRPIGSAAVSGEYQPMKRQRGATTLLRFRHGSGHDHQPPTSR